MKKNKKKIIIILVSIILVIGIGITLFLIFFNKGNDEGVDIKPIDAEAYFKEAEHAAYRGYPDGFRGADVRHENDEQLGFRAARRSRIHLFSDKLYKSLPGDPDRYRVHGDPAERVGLRRYPAGAVEHGTDYF